MMKHFVWLLQNRKHGIPVVVCNFGSLNERVKNYETGFVCDNESEFSIKTIKLFNRR